MKHPSCTAIPACTQRSVGIIVWHPSQKFILLQERAKPPYGLACPAGHVDPGESFETAALRELAEETGLQVSVHDLRCTFEDVLSFPCRRPGGSHHYWKVYDVTLAVNQPLTPAPDEVRAQGWYSLETLHALTDRTKRYQRGKIPEQQWRQFPGVEPAWDFIFRFS